jgi:hypothetical protein
MQEAGEFILSGLFSFSPYTHVKPQDLSQRGPATPLADLAGMFAPDHLDDLVQFLQKV